jgi:hypothetical protein
MTTPRVVLGDIDIPDGWSMATSIELREPPREGLAMPLAGKGDTKRAGANIMVAREVAPNTTAPEALDVFIKSYGSSVEGFSRLAEGPVTFVDGRDGVSVTVAFSIGGYRAAQLHLFRVDGGIVSHVTVSVDERSKSRLDGELLEVARSFRVRPVK